MKNEAAIATFGHAGVVGDDDEGFAGFIDDAEEHVHDGGTCGGVEIAGGFVGVEDAGIVDEGAGDGDALLFAAGEFGGEVVEAFGEANAVEELASAGFGIAFADPGGEEDIFQSGEFGEEEVVLEDKTHAAVAQGGAVTGVGVVKGFAVDEDVAGGGTFEAAEDIEQGGFTGAGSTAEKDFFSSIHFEVHAAQYVEVMAAHLVAPMDILGVKRVGVGWGHEASGVGWGQWFRGLGSPADIGGERGQKGVGIKKSENKLQKL